MVHFFAASTATLEKRVECGAAAQVHSMGTATQATGQERAFVDLLPSSKVGTIILRAFWLASPYSGSNLVGGVGGGGGGGGVPVIRMRVLGGMLTALCLFLGKCVFGSYVMHYGVGIRVFYRPRPR